MKLNDSLGAITDSARIALAGDVDGDGDIDNDDLALLKKIVNCEVRPDYRMYRAANINNDRRVDTFDVSLLAAKLRA